MANMMTVLKSQSRTFATLKSKIQETEEEMSDISDSDESGSWILVFLRKMVCWMPLLTAVVTSYVLTFLLVIPILGVSLIT